MTNKTSRLLLFMLACMSSMVLMAQNRTTVTGSVRDSVGNALAGITVSVKGAKSAAVTDDQGTFKLTAPNAGATLVFSGVGYTSQEVKVGNSNTVSITMQANARSLNEVIVTGFGTKKDLRKVAY